MSSELLAVLLSFQPSEFKQKREYDAAARSFVSQLNNVSATHFLKGADTPQDILSVLDPTENSIAYAFILRHRITALIDKKTVPESARPGGALWNKVVLFLEEFDPVQMRYAGAEWRRLVDLVEQIARTMGTPGIAIAPIRSALTRLDPTTGAFTLAHLSFIRLCMETRSYVAATPILDNYIHSIASHIPAAARESLEYSVACAETATSGEYVHQHSGHTEKVTPADIQEYYILGAMAYLGVRQFKKAQHFLEHALVVPSNNVANGSMLEAYKKWVLVSCLVDGSAKAPPRTANVQAMKQVKAAAKAYEALAEAFAQTTNFPKLRAQIAAGKDIWVEDGNGGLVKELQESQHRFYVSRLSRTFSAIPVSNIAVNMGGSTEEVTDYLETLIRDGHLNARVERPNKPEAGIVLRFFLDPAQGPLAKSEKQQQQALFEQTTRTNVLAEQVKDADYRLTLTKEYIDNVKRQNKKQSQGGDTMDVSWDDHVDLEEDIMDDRH